MASIWTVSELNEQISAWKDTLLSLSNGQEVTGPDGRQLTYADLPEVRKTLRFLQHELASLQGESGPIKVSGRIRR